MKERNGHIITGILFLFTAILNVLTIDYSTYDWLDVLPAILFAIVGILSFRNAWKKKELNE